MTIKEHTHSVMRHSKNNMTFVLTIPVDWVRAHKLNARDKVKILSNGLLVIVPPDVYESEKFTKRGGMSALKRALVETL